MAEPVGVLNGDLAEPVCRLSNGASYSRQEQSDLQRVKSSLLDGQAASKKRVRPTSGRDRESSPSTSTAHRSQDRAARRAFLHEGGADSKPYRPVRSVHASCMYSIALFCEGLLFTPLQSLLSLDSTTLEKMWYVCWQCLTNIIV